jgi:hypothetical protein
MSVIKQTIKEKEENLVQLAAKQEEFQTSSKNAHQEEQVHPWLCFTQHNLFCLGHKLF